MKDMEMNKKLRESVEEGLWQKSRRKAQDDGILLHALGECCHTAPPRERQQLLFMLSSIYLSQMLVDIALPEKAGLTAMPPDHYVA